VCDGVLRKYFWREKSYARRAIIFRLRPKTVIGSFSLDTMEHVGPVFFSTVEHQPRRTAPSPRIPPKPPARPFRAPPVKQQGMRGDEVEPYRTIPLT
jgi:hypothetical protein